MHPCPSCGFEVFQGPPGGYELCPVCDWEDDELQLRFPGYRGGANDRSLCEQQRRALAKLRDRTAMPRFRRHPTWRPLREEECVSEPDEREPYVYYWERGEAPGRQYLRVTEGFHLAGRGLVVTGEGTLDALVPGVRTEVEIVHPNGDVVRRTAFREWMLVRAHPVLEREALLVEDATRDEVPPGCIIYLAAPHR